MRAYRRSYRDGSSLYAGAAGKGGAWPPLEDNRHLEFDGCLRFFPAVDRDRAVRIHGHPLHLHPGALGGLDGATHFGLSKGKGARHATTLAIEISIQA